MQIYLTMKYYFLTLSFMPKTGTIPCLLSSADPEPVQVINSASNSPVFLLSEHAGNQVPVCLHNLGVSRDVLDSHRGWDIGAADVAKGLAERLGAPLVIQRYIRLVIDCNRPIGAPGSIPEVSDEVAIPGNQALSQEAKDARAAEIFEPMDQAINSLFDRHKRRIAISLHSFTPEMNGKARPWHAGFLARRDLSAAQGLMTRIQANNPALTLALNQPYQIEDEGDWFIPAHAEARGVPHCLVEIRNDELLTPGGIARWSNLLADAITDLLETLP